MFMAKKSPMLIRDIMTREVITIGPERSIGDAIALMRQGGFRRLPVVSEDERLVGVITDRDLRQATNSPLVLREQWYSNFLLDAIKVKACMTPDPITITPDATVLEAAQLLRKHKIGGLPVVDDHHVVGIATTTDMLDCLINLLQQKEVD